MDLPTCMLVEIFKRLPVKTIIGCRCLSKSFSKLLSEPYFLNAYHMQQPLAIMLKKRWGSKKPLRFIELSGDKQGQGFKFRKPIKANLPPNIGRGHIDLLGSSKGLVCFRECPFSRTSRTTIHVCNPILGQCLTLPYGRWDDNGVVSCGFGFNPPTKLYKAIIIHEECGGKEAYVEILTVGVDVNWRILKLEYCPLFSDFEGIDFQGIQHKKPVCDTNLMGNHGFIYALDLGEEKFSSIQTPPNYEIWEVRNLLVLKNCLCLSSCTYPDFGELSLWRMKEYGAGESWFKEYTIREDWVSRCPADSSRHYDKSSFNIWGQDDDSVLIVYSAIGCDEVHMICCHLDERKYTILDGAGIDETELKLLCTFSPSLISLENLLIGGQTKVLNN